MEQKCKNIVRDKLKERMADVEQALEFEDREESENYPDPLCIDATFLLNIVLSTGGPGDGFKIEFHMYGEARRGWYYWQDWGDYAEEMLEEDQLQQVLLLYGLDDPELARMRLK